MDQDEFDRIVGSVETTLDREMRENVRGIISEEEVELAMKSSANEKSPGLDGIPTEIWKLLHQQYKSAKERRGPASTKVGCAPYIKRRRIIGEVKIR